MKIKVFDLESDGLLNDASKIHCLGSSLFRSGNDPIGFRNIDEAISDLEDADVLVGHNIISFDLPVLLKIHKWKPRKGVVIRDTLVMSRLLWPRIFDYDYAKKKIPNKLWGSHRLEAWGHRLGVLKGEYDGGWSEWSQDMYDYMLQDVRVTDKLLAGNVDELKKWGIDPFDSNPEPRKDCVELEHRVAEIAFKIEQHGFNFDKSQAATLVGKLVNRQQEMLTELQKVFPPRIEKEIFVPKVNSQKFGYVKGVPVKKVRTIPFNPNSRQEIARRLQETGWKPSKFTNGGSPQIDDEVLSLIPTAEAKILAEWFVVEKRLGTVANGEQAWFRHLRDGRIHHRINTNGAHTGRMTHSGPNLAQVPANHAPYGEDCRACFVADDGHILVGVDADALELRDLAGYMAIFDNGAYIDTVLKGNKSNGTDMHSINARILGISRDNAKTFFYAFIYGAGDQNLGAQLGAVGDVAQRRRGKEARAKLLAGLPALGRLIELVGKKIEQNGFLVGLDGRRLTARSKNAALNTLLQSAGAVQMKRGLVILYDMLVHDLGFKWGEDFAILALIHDEWQATVKPELAELYAETAVNAIRKAGEFYGFRCPLDGQAQKGMNWKETH